MEYTEQTSVSLKDTFKIYRLEAKPIETHSIFFFFAVYVFISKLLSGVDFSNSLIIVQIKVSSRKMCPLYLFYTA